MQIGFSQPLEHSWLDAALDWTASGISPEEVREQLDELLARKIAVGTSSKKSSRYKRVCQLMTIWVTPRPNLVDFRNHLLKQFISDNSRTALHFAMLTATYPFFWSVSAQIGRMLRLQDEISMTQIKRRCKETLGERDTVAYAATRVVKTFVDFGLLKRAEKIGNYSSPDLKFPVDAPLTAVLFEACMLAEMKHSNPIEALLAAPALFPFQLPSARELVRHHFSRLAISAGEHGSERVTLSGHLER